MSWMKLLHDTYENAAEHGELDGEPRLYPIAHTTQNAEIEVYLSEEGEFKRGEVILDKNSRKTLVPCSEESASRSGKYPKAHPLFDKLQYLAGDYTKYGGEKGTRFHKDYMEGLKAWCDSAYGNPYVKTVSDYLVKGTLIEDLVNGGVLYCKDGTEKLLSKWDGDKKDRPAIFEAIVGNQTDAFVRFSIHIFGSNDVKLYEDKSVQEDYIRYYLQSQQSSGLCYITGQEVLCAKNHPSKIRHTGDKAKLISANDTSNFTFRGRVDKPEQVVQVGYEVSQKAHNALKWLIEKQGRIIGDRAFLIWSDGGEPVPDPLRNSDEIMEEARNKWEEQLADLGSDLQENVERYDTEEDFARAFNKAITGYKTNLLERNDTEMAIMTLDAATTGRMAITHYREFKGREIVTFLDNLEQWYETGSWRQWRYSKEQKKPYTQIGMPSLIEIIKLAYGIELDGGKIEVHNKKLMAATIERLLPCVVNQLPVPLDIVRALEQRAMNPQKYKKEHNWQQVMCVTCSVVKKYRYEKSRGREVWNTMINVNSDDITYNCGRLLAVANEIERQVLRAKNDNRQTNAKRYFSKFAAHPCKIWGIISDKLQPYEASLGNRGANLYKMRQQISSIIPPEEFAGLRNLDGRMLLGYDAQIAAIYDKKNEDLVSEEGEVR